MFHSNKRLPVIIYVLSFNSGRYQSESIESLPKIFCGHTNDLHVNLLTSLPFFVETLQSSGFLNLAYS